MDILQLSERSDEILSPASVSKELVLGKEKCIELVGIDGFGDTPRALQTLLCQEEKHYRSQCLQGDETTPAVLDWFSSMTEWCFSVVDGYNLPPQTVEAAMNILDRYVLSTCQSTDPTGRQSISLKPSIFRSCSQFKLITVTCLHIASKSNSSSRTLTPNMLETLARKETEARDIETMEMKIVSTMKFQIKPPAIVSFAEEMKKELQIWSCDNGETNELQESLFLLLVEQQARLAMTKLLPFQVCTSSIALACVKNALVVMEAQSLLGRDTVSLSSSTFQKAWRQLEKEIQLSSGMSGQEFLDVQATLQSKLRTITRQAAFEWKQKNCDHHTNISIHALEDSLSSSLRVSARSLTTIQEVGKTSP